MHNGGLSWPVPKETNKGASLYRRESSDSKIAKHYLVWCSFHPAQRAISQSHGEEHLGGRADGKTGHLLSPQTRSRRAETTRVLRVPWSLECRLGHKMGKRKNLSPASFTSGHYKAPVSIRMVFKLYPHPPNLTVNRFPKALMALHVFTVYRNLLYLSSISPPSLLHLFPGLTVYLHINVFLRLFPLRQSDPYNNSTFIHHSQP